MATILLVPVHLDALHVTTAVAVVAPGLPYANLSRFVSGGKNGAERPYLASALAAFASQDIAPQLEPGIHLHWSMPDTLTHDDGDRGLRPIPNRWVIRRDRGGLDDRAWFIESDVVRLDDPAPGAAAAIPWSDARAPAWLGRTRDLPAGESTLPFDDGTAATVLDPFTIDIAGELTFAALYSRCAGVFGLHDPDISGDVPAGLRYRLYGYHEQAANDPVVELLGKPGSVAALIDAELHWLVTTNDDTVERCAYYATLDLPNGTPADAPDPSNLPPGSDVIAVALGNTTSEALAALEAEEVPSLDESVATVQFLAEDGRIDTDLQQALDDYRHTHGFHAEVGERRWVLRPKPPSPGPVPAGPGGQQPGAGGAGGQQPGAAGGMIRLVDQSRLAQEFGRLVGLQQRYDAAWRRIEALRDQLFDGWCDYLRSAYPPQGSQTGSRPDADDMRQYLKGRILVPLETLIRRAGRIAWEEGHGHNSVEPTIDHSGGGPLAEGVIDGWRSVQALLGPRDGAPYDLLFASGPRFWAPRELSVVLRGGAVEPSVRHGADGHLDKRGRLWCDAIAVTGPADPAAASGQIFDKLDQMFDFWAGGEEPWIAFSRVRTQPWHPIVLEWGLDFEAFAAAQPAGGGPYPTDFLTRNFRHDPDRPELVRVEDDPPRASPVALSGWAVLTRGAQQTVSSAIRRYSAELQDHQVDPFWAIHDLWDLGQRLEAGPQILSCPLNGLDDALLARRWSPQLPVRDPLARPGSESESFAHRVANVIGDPPGSAPDPALSLQPFRTGFIHLTGLRVVGNFGTVRALDVSHVALPSTFSKVSGGDHVFLPPRLIPPARLQLRWLDASSVADKESTDHPSTSPVHGWLVIDYFDARILAFDRNGARLGAIELDGDDIVWVPAPAPMTSDVMGAVVGRVRAAGKAWFDAFVQSMAEAQELIDPADAGQHKILSMLVSRPIAVARARVDIELAGLPPRSASWDALQRAIDDDGGRDRDDSEFGVVDVPVRLGAPPPSVNRTARLDDGLLGFWTDDDDVLRMPKSTVTEVGLAPHDDPVHPPQVLVRTGGTPVNVTLLLDPRGQVHAISGVLPTKRLGLDPGYVVQALNAMEISFRAGPILTRPGVIDHVKPTDTDLRWTWVDDDASLDERSIEALDRQAPLPAALELREGFLRLRRGVDRD